MRQIRKSTFETNSSSAHSLVILKEDLLSKALEDAQENLFYTDEEIAKDMKWACGYMSWEFSRFPFRVLTDFWEKFAYAYANGFSQAELNAIVEELSPSCDKVEYKDAYVDEKILQSFLDSQKITLKEFLSSRKYIVICDGDEYFVWNQLKNSGVIDTDAILYETGSGWEEV